MRLRSLVLLAVAGSSFAVTPCAFAQDPMADGLVRGDYFRLSGGAVRPVNPKGSLKNWGQGAGFNLMWENWDLSGSGGGGQMGLFGFSLFGDLSFLPFKESQFKIDFADGPNGAITTASADKARVIQIGVNTRFRIPMRYIMPSISVGFGFLDWHPGEITYTAARTGTAEQRAKQQNRQGGAVIFTGALDKHIFDRYALFGEAAYTYGFTSWGQVAGSSSICVTSECDLLKNTPLGVIRGGIRFRYK